MTTGTEIAIVGAACRVADASDPATFFANLLGGRESITHFRRDEIDSEFGHLVDDPSFVRAASILDGVDRFDASFFRMSGREAELTDPQRRLALECAWEALEDAGYGDPDRIAGPVGVYTGSWASTYAAIAAVHAETPAEEFQALVGSGVDYLPTFLSYKMNLRGESLAIQTACSSSLVAVHVACQGLLTGAIDMAIAGGASVDARQKTGYLYQRGMIYSPDGHCRPFDHRAQGTVRGFGLGLVALKRLDDALRDGDFIRAVIRGSATNNDGRHKIGFTAPSIKGQAEVVAAALAAADVDPETLGYVEAHGTGTPLGDPIEVEALRQAFGARRREYCAIGSVKSNLGHLVEAAGIIGLLKATLALEHGVVPPTLHFERPNAQIRFAETPFLVAARATPWPDLGPSPRRAGVSSFGIGGTNCHVVLEEAPRVERRPEARGAVAIPLSAHTDEALSAMRARLRSWLLSNQQASLGDVAHTLTVGRKALPRRWVRVVTTHEELLRELHHEDAGASPNGAPSSPLEESALRWSRGDDAALTSSHDRRGARRVPLPTYPFERKRYWIDRAPTTPARPRGFGAWLGAAKPGPAASAPPRPELLVLASPTREQLEARLAHVRAAAERSASSLEDVCSLGSVEGDGAHRAAFVCSTHAELVRRIDEAAHVGFGRPPRRRGKLAFVFSGQGGQWANMGRQLLREEPRFREIVEACDAALEPFGARPVARELAADQHHSTMHRSEVAQPAVLAVQVGLTALLREWGVVPEAVVGQSIGEVAAAVVSGALDLTQATRLAFERGRLMASTAGRGKTAFIKLAAAEVDRSLSEIARSVPAGASGVTVAGEIGPDSTLISGEPDVVAHVLAVLGERGVYCRELQVDIAFHGPQMDPLVAPLEAGLAGLVPGAAQVPFYSAVDGAWRNGDELVGAYWGRNLRRPFRLARAVEAMAKEGYTDLVEIGPHPVLSDALEATLRRAGVDGIVVPTLHRKRDERTAILTTLATLHASQHDVARPAPVRLTAEEPPRPSQGGLLAEVHACVAACLRTTRDELSVDAPLLDVGMDSVTALTVLRRLADRFGAALTPEELVVASTVSGLVRRISAEERGADFGGLLPLRPRPAQPQLVLFPGAGATSLMLVPWTDPALLPDLDVVGVSPPGHGADERAPLRSVAAMCDLVVSLLPPRPRILLGHSLGATVAYAVAAELERQGRPPAAVIVAHGLPPAAFRALRFSQDPRFVETFDRLFEAWGAPSQGRDRFLDSARADFEAAETFNGTSRVRVPAFVIAGRDDREAPLDALSGWSELFERVTTFHAAGGHFDFLAHPENREVLRTVYEAARAELPPPT
jgi:acyl transferase domain-containing protein/surfactin synthase thioesterase subunit